MWNEQPNPADWSGGIDPTSEPHRCPYRLKGAYRRECIEDLSGKSVGLNISCCGTMRGEIRYEPCNFVARRCRKCLDLGRRGLKANAVVDPKSGLCEEHAASPPIIVSQTTTVTGKKEGPVRLELTPRFREFFRDLTDEEKKVVCGIVFKRDLSAIDTQLMQDPKSSGKSLADILEVLFHRFELMSRLDLPREDQRRFALGKLYRLYLIERGELEAEDQMSEPTSKVVPKGTTATTSVLGDDVLSASEANPSPAVTSDPKSTDVVGPSSVEPQHEKPAVTDKIAVTEASGVRDAYDVARRFCTAKTGNGESPSIRAVYDAVAKMSKTKMTVNAIGKAFGQNEKSAGTWTYLVRSLSRLATSSWSVIEGKWFPITTLVKIAKLPEKEQILKLQAALEETPKEKDRDGVARRHAAQKRSPVAAASSIGEETRETRIIADDRVQNREPASVSVLPPNPGLRGISPEALGPITILPISEEAFKTLLNAGMFKNKGRVIIIGPPNESGVSEAQIVSFKGVKD